MLGAHGPIAERTFHSGYMDDVYEGMDFNPIVWTPCTTKAVVNHTVVVNATALGGRNTSTTAAAQSYWIRIESRIVAQKARLEDEDVQIAIDSSDATLAKGRLEYAMVSRPCA